LIKSTTFEPGKTGGSVQDNYNTLLKTAKRNGVAESSIAKVLGYDDINQAMDELATGESINNFEQKIRNYAKTAMPDNVRNLIDQGYDLMDIIGPYQSTIADELEVPYTTVDVTNKYVQDALSKNMNLSELRRLLRKDAQWQYTDKARQEVNDVLLTVKRNFGLAG
jgi:transcriptional regulator